MVQDRYEVHVVGDIFEYKFTSIGPNGPVTKVVEFKRISDTDHAFNLAFGDLDEITQMMNDFVVTDNKDTQKVLATVAHIVTEFTKLQPDALIYATGSTDARNRLYQMTISKHLSEIEETFDVWGEVKDRIFIRFIGGINFTAFLAKRKKL